VRAATVHLIAQLIRHQRGFLTTVEKWIGQTPPEAVHEESREAIFRMRGVLIALEEALVHAPVNDRTVTASTTTDRPAPPAARSSDT